MTEKDFPEVLYRVFGNDFAVLEQHLNLVRLTNEAAKVLFMRYECNTHIANAVREQLNSLDTLNRFTWTIK